MTPSLQRTLRELRLPAFVALSLGVVALTAWSTHRREMRGAATPSMCSRLMDEAFGLDAARTPDSVLLKRLLVHRARCMGDAAYVDQVRRLMLNAQRVAAARALLVEAEQRRAFTADRLAAQRAWVDLEESREANLGREMSRGTMLRARVLATTKRLRMAWPEWDTPYLILGELERSAPNEPAASLAVTEDAYALARAARSRVVTGAFVRSLSAEQTIALACALVALGLLGFGMAASGVIAIAAMRRTPTVNVAEARPGFVELAGALRLPPRADAVIGPLSKMPGVWYALESSFGSRGSHTWRERSAQRFILRDATGEVAIEPSGAVVRTRHVWSQFGKGAFASPRRETERLLQEGDAAYVAGELALAKTGSGVERVVRMPEDGRRLLVSTYTEAELTGQERIWVWSGVLVSALSLAVLMWGYAQRYEVPVGPG